MDINSNKQEQDDKNEKAQTENELSQPSRKWGPQIVGATIGAFCFMILGGLANQFGWQIGQTSRFWLWGAVIGGLIGSAESLENAGARLTNSDKRWLNIVVSLLGMVVLFGIILGLSDIAEWILSLLNR